MPTVSGIVRNETGGPALGATVQVFDRDLRHEQLLGEVIITETSGRYEITYTAEKFRRAEKKSADLIVRAFDRAGNLRAESEIRFNARDTERIDLTFGPIATQPRPRLSELEELKGSIEPVLEGVSYYEFTDEDLTFLTEESIRAGSLGVLERRLVRERLGFLRLADQFARQTKIQLEAFYGWFRLGQPENLDELLDVPSSTLRAALVTAIRDRIIPDITAQLDEILEQLETWLFEQGRKVNHRFVVQLVNAATNQPLVGYFVEVTDPAAVPDDRQLGTLITDSKGACEILFTLPGDTSINVTRRLTLVISDDEVEVAEASLDVHANQDEVTTLRLRLREIDAGAIPIEGLTEAALAARLREQGIRSLNDVLAHPEVEDDAAEELERLRATAKFAVLAPHISPTERNHLLSRGHQSVLDIGANSRAEFVRNERDELGGDANTYATHFAAKETSKVFYHMVGSAWLKLVTSPDDEPPDPDIPTGVDDVLGKFTKCGCKDCDSAVSPTAYLAHLLEWTIEHIKDDSASIAFPQLAEEFHQPFGTLPASCGAVEQQVQQVRICVEVLWSFSEFLTLDDLQFPTSFRTSYRHLRNQLYRLILNKLGTSFEQLRTAVLQIEGDSLAAQQVASQRQAVADLLGIDESHLNQLFFNIEQPPTSPTEADLERRFGFKSTRAEDVFEVPDTPDLLTWQRERLESIWESQDWSLDAYEGEGRLPFVDPALIDETYLRSPFANNPAFNVLEARRQTLAEHREALVNQNPQQNGLPDLLENELNQSIEELRAVYATLQSDESSAITQAHETIASLNLTPAGFNHLMDVDARIVANEPIGATDDEINNSWEAVFDILNRARGRSLFPAWVEEENELNLILGPTRFWFPEVQPPLNTWQATSSERSRWEEALRSRSGYPLIDPDQIRLQNLTVLGFVQGQTNLGFAAPGMLLPPLTPMSLWQQRRTWIDNRLDAVRDARQDQANPMETLQAALEASTLGIEIGLFDELANLEAGGRDPEARLAQLGLTISEFRFLAGIHQLALGNGSVGAQSWQELDAVLVQGEKRRQFAAWRAAEQANRITLHPERFELTDELIPEDSPQTRWLHNPVALRSWNARLEARKSQLQALGEGLASAVDSAAEIVLPLLRNILIMQTNADGNSLNEKADWLDRRLLIDMRMDACQRTSRVSQAIETLQRFIRGVYTQEHLPLMEHLTLDTEDDYQAEWPIIGTYATWRAYMLAYLYPENLLHLTPSTRESYGFAQLKKNLPSRIEPAHACAAAAEYSNYFKDIFHLEVQASCHVRTRIDREVGCGTTTAVLQPRVHLFAIATNSGKVYTNSFDSYFDSKDTLDVWRPVPKLSDVLEIVSAVPHETPTQRRLILLFVKVRDNSKTSLKFVAFDLDTNDWTAAKASELDLPPEAGGDFSAVAVQKRHGSGGETLVFEAPDDPLSNKSVPSVLAIRVPNGKIYVRYLNNQATDWAGSEWIPLFGNLKADDFSELCALVQRSRDEYLMVVRHPDGMLAYRIFSVEPVISRDDGFWRTIAKGKFRGAFAWPGAPDVAVFYEKAGGMRYKIIGETAELIVGGLSNSSILALNGWLISVVGVSLEDFPLDLTVDAVLAHWPKQQVQGGNCSFSDVPFGVQYTGNLLDMLTLTEPVWDLELPELRWEEPSCLSKQLSEYKQEILEDFQTLARDTFEQAVARASKASFQDLELGQWKLADWYVQQFGGSIFPGVAFGLFSAVTNAFLGADDQSFRFRGAEIGSQRSLAQLRSARIVPSGGDEDTGPDPRKPIVFNKSNGSFRQKLQRNGDSLAPATSRTRVTPTGDGPFDLTPLVAKEDLQIRRAEVKQMYQGMDPQLSLRVYLREAYNHIPAYLGYELQRNGHYEEALLWYRQAYDYLQPKSKRKIDYGLKLEETLSVTYEDAEEWLNDASNAHAIAATRQNTYTRNILLLIIRCLIDYGDALFSRDNVTDNTRARELYTIALRLLDDLGAIKPGSAQCANIIGQLEIELVEGEDLPFQQFKQALAQIPDPDRLTLLATSLRTINQDTDRPVVDRLGEMRDALVAAINELPAPKRMTEISDTRRETLATLENQLLSSQPARTLLAKTQQQRRGDALASLAITTDRTEESLLEPATELTWLRQARTEDEEDAFDQRLELTSFDAPSSRRLATLNQIKTAMPMTNLVALNTNSFTINTGISFDFCIPQNPVIQALITRAANNLTKLRTCRNIAGFLREIDPYGAPIGIGAGMVSPDGTIFSGIVDAPPTPYRYLALVSRAKELVGIAQQIEAGYQSALVSAEGEAFTLLQAEQSVELAGAQVTVQDLRVTQANTELGLTQLQKGSAVLREGTYTDWIDAGLSSYETKTLEAYRDAGDAQEAAAKANAIGQVASAAMALIPSTALEAAQIGFSAAFASVVAASAIAEGVYNVQAIRAQTELPGQFHVGQFRAAGTRMAVTARTRGLRCTDQRSADRAGQESDRHRRAGTRYRESGTYPRDRRSELSSQQGLRRRDVSVDSERARGGISLLLAGVDGDCAAGRTTTCLRATGATSQSHSNRLLEHDQYRFAWCQCRQVGSYWLSAIAEGHLSTR